MFWWFKKVKTYQKNFEKMVWINISDIILVVLPDLILKYNTDEEVNLQAYGKLPKHAKIKDIDIFDAEIQFDNTEYDDKDHDDI